jgi:hypothetical protein
LGLEEKRQLFALALRGLALDALKPWRKQVLTWLSTRDLKVRWKTRLKNCARTVLT